MSAEMNEEEKKFIKNFASALEDFTKHRPNMPVHHVAMLLKLALDEGKSQKYYSINWKTPPATVSRIMLDFGKRMRHGEPGMGLIDERISAHSLREHEVYLSDTGKALLRKVIGKLRK
jgi:hypothetical protein